MFELAFSILSNVAGIALSEFFEFPNCHLARDAPQSVNRISHENSSSVVAAKIVRNRPCYIEDCIDSGRILQ